MTGGVRLALALAFFVTASERAGAQQFGSCATASNEELRRSIAAHEENLYRLNMKFVRVYYYRGQIPTDFEAATLNDVDAFLTAFPTKNVGVLFYARLGQRLCVWLISPGGNVTGHATSVSAARIQRLSLRVGGLREGVRGLGSGPPAAPSSEAARLAALDSLGALLLPGSIAQSIRARRIARLTVIPVGELGGIPFPALRFAGEQLIDAASVVIAPGFSALREAPTGPTNSFQQALIVSDPTGYRDSKFSFAPLDGARSEADSVARLVGTEAITGRSATRALVLQRLRQNPSLIYFATHGVASATDPRDASFLLMSDGRLTAAEIQDLPLEGARPLVVLSACQTGLGKDFEVGTIGMARAWARAGASNIVMSLWNVADHATAAMMPDFIRSARTKPPDIALREAMLSARSRDPSPALWAGFTVFGTPSLEN